MQHLVNHFYKKISFSLVPLHLITYQALVKTLISYAMFMDTKIVRLSSKNVELVMNKVFFKAIYKCSVLWWLTFQH